MISFCTPAKGRLHHLRQTFRHNVELISALGIEAEFVLVNVGCPDGMDEWAKSELRGLPSVCYYRAAVPVPEYSIARSDNTAMRLGRGPFVSNLMADNFLTARYVEQVLALARPGAVVAGEAIWPEMLECFGRQTFFKEDFLALGGYDERMAGWGYADEDLLERAKAARYSVATWDRSEARSISHDDAERSRFASVDRADSHRQNQILSAASLHRMRLVANQGMSWGDIPVERVL